uniref:Uncharacterized protein n=1 Tax=Elaeophora elaphi TaxID=1147741 RepID=A0A0R3RYP9_9BILA
MTKIEQYNAPPPYESSLDEDPQRRNDWHCLLENQIAEKMGKDEIIFIYCNKRKRSEKKDREEKKEKS